MRLLILSLSFLWLVSVTTNAETSQRAYLLATATTGGTYYPVGVAISTLVKLKLEPITGLSLSAISSAGSGENLKLLREQQIHFALLQGLWGAWAWEGSGKVSREGPQSHLRSITTLWQNVEHIGIRTALVANGTVSDLANLKGLSFSIGARNSGTEGSGREILSNLGLDPDTYFDLAYLGYNPSADAMRNGTIEGFNMPAGPPVSAVTQAFSAMGDRLTILDFTNDEIALANSGRTLWTRYTIPPGTYPGQRAPINTVGQPNILVVRKDVGADDVYRVTKAMYENLPFLAAIHKATAEMTLESALTGLPLPLHPGAERYYEEAGLEIPEHLAAR